MLIIDLPPTLQMRLNTVIEDSYHGDVQAAVAAFLQLHEKYGWKEQLYQDVTAIRDEMQRRGGITQYAINDAIKRYREQIEADGE
jgi:hypothetical protein